MPVGDVKSGRRRIIPFRIPDMPFVLLRTRQKLLNTILRKDFELALKFVIFVGSHDYEPVK